MFDINSFVSEINANKFAPTQNYEVLIMAPQGLQASLPMQQLSLRAQSVVYPGRSVATTPQMNYGPPRNVAMESQHGAFTVKFLCSEDFSEKTFFQRWQDISVGNYRRRTGFTPGAFDLGYYSNYVGTVIINQYDAMGQITYTCTLIEAYPILVAELHGEYGSDAPHILSVDFQYYIFNDDPEPVNAQTSTTTA